jgi:expansin (peptidoglycan-binding protein)
MDRLRRNRNIIPLLTLATLAWGQDSLVTKSFFSVDSLHTGRATFYYVDKGRGSCGLPSSDPWDTLSAAMNNPDFHNSEVCGACAMVTGPIDSVLLRINDRCPGCKSGDLDLTTTAFKRIANIKSGTVPIAWHFAPCPPADSLAIHFTPKSSKWYISMQLQNHTNPIHSLEIKTDTGWQNIPRKYYNRFVVSRPPPAPWSLRIRDIMAQEWIDTTVSLTPGVLQPLGIE